MNSTSRVKSPVQLEHGPSLLSKVSFSREIPAFPSRTILAVHFARIKRSHSPRDDYVFSNTSSRVIASQPLRALATDSLLSRQDRTLFSATRHSEIVVETRRDVLRSRIFRGRRIRAHLTRSIHQADRVARVHHLHSVARI